MLPKLAGVFGVSIDYLMVGQKKGIAIAGNIIADVVKSIAEYPKPGMLTYISAAEHSVGGCVPNTAINLAKIDRSIPICALGKVGSDENGRFILSQMQKHGIDTEKIRISPYGVTSFCDVMSMPTGERTFFHTKGANAEFSPADIPLSALDCDLLHIGYILLLDAFDKTDDAYGTVMAKFLHDAQEKGIRTSIDVVSDSSADYAEKIIPALKYCNYAIINEIECCRIWGLEPRTDDRTINRDVIVNAMKKMAEAGVKDKVIIHSKECCFALDVPTGVFTEVWSLNIPKEEIKGSVGAGDAFCAGCLYGIYNNFPDRQLLEFASAAAGFSLFAANAVDGMRRRSQIEAMADQYERMESHACQNG
jgi:sugar/nucleoside kinase (ribokinase family)